MPEIRQTSIETYRRIRDQGLLTVMRFQWYSALFNHGPLTRAEVVKHLEFPGQERQPDGYNRLSELRKQGVARVVGSRECSVTGNRCQIWDVTDQLPSTIVTTPKPTKAEFQVVVEELTEIQRTHGFDPSPVLMGAVRWMAEQAEVPAAPCWYEEGQAPEEDDEDGLVAMLDALG